MRWLAIGASALFLVYLSAGALLFVLKADDLGLRWLEGNYFNAGVNPFDVAAEKAPADPELGGLPQSAGYPPWSFVMGELVVFPWLPYPVAKLLFAALQALAIGVLFSSAWSFPGLPSRWSRLLVASGSLASLSLTTVLRHGNYGLVVAGLLAAACGASIRGRAWTAGCCLGAAMLKPQLAVPFLVPLCVKGEWRSLSGALLLVGTAWLSAALWVGESPLRLLTQMLTTATGPQVNWHTLGVLDAGRLLGVGSRDIVFSSAVIGLVAAALVCWRYRALDMRTLWAVSAVTVTVWGPWRGHDLVLLSFLFAPTLAAAIAQPTKPRVTLAAAVAASMWIPHLARFDTSMAAVYGYRIVWLAVLLGLLRLRHEGSAQLTPELPVPTHPAEAKG